MDTVVHIDERLLAEAKELLGEPDSDAAVARVLERFCQARRKHQDLLDISGTIEFHDDYDPKRLRFTRYDAD